MTSSKLIVAFVAVLCVARSCSEMAEFGRKKIKLLKCFLKLKHGIPSHDTFSTVLRMLDQKALDAAFGRLTARLVAALAKGGVIAVVDCIDAVDDGASQRLDCQLVSRHSALSHVFPA